MLSTKMQYVFYRYMVHFMLLTALSLGHYEQAQSTFGALQPAG